MTDWMQDDHRAFQDSFRRFLATLGEPGELLTRAGSEDFLGMQAAEERGGGGADDPRFAAAGIAELACSGAVGAALSYAAHVGCALPLLEQRGSLDLRDRWTGGLVTGKNAAAVALGGITGAAAAGGWTLAGTDPAVVNGAIADCLLLAFTDQTGARQVAVVGPEDGGVTRHAVESSGLAGAHLAEVSAMDLAVPSSQVIPDGDRLLADARLWMALIAVSGARAALETTASYVRERRVFGRPLASFENTRRALGRVAGMLSTLAAALDSLLIRRCADRLTRHDAAALLAAALDAFGHAADAGLQLHGGYGYMLEYPISTAYADAQALALLGMAVDPSADLADAAGV